MKRSPHTGLVQSESQSTVFPPSSHSSPTSRRLFPQNSVERQSARHPSPDMIFPSSQTSPGSAIPLPQSSSMQLFPSRLQVVNVGHLIPDSQTRVSVSREQHAIATASPRAPAIPFPKRPHELRNNQRRSKLIMMLFSLMVGVVARRTWASRTACTCASLARVLRRRCRESTSVCRRSSCRLRLGVLLGRIRSAPRPA